MCQYSRVMMSQDSSPERNAETASESGRDAAGLDALPEIPPPQNAPVPRVRGRFDGLGKHLRGAGLVSSVGIILVVCIVIGYVLGKSVDSWLGTDPVGVAVGVLLGSAAGFVELFRLVSKAMNEQESSCD